MRSYASDAQAEQLRKIAARTPQSQKTQYLESLSEDDFRDKVVRPIFKHLGYSDGRDTCGADEMGRDAIFTQTSQLSGLEITVVQTKKGKITKSGKPSENLDTICTQLRTAVDTPVRLLSKEKRKPLRGFLVASGEIKRAAIDHIVDEIRDPRLAFLDGPQLVSLIDEYMPELWLDIDSDVLPYFRAVANALEQGHELLPGTLSPISATHSVTVDDYFANVSIFRPFRKRLANARKPKKTEFPKIDTLPITSVVTRPERLILLTGGFGSGKSTALKRILYECAVKPFVVRDDLLIPVLMRAKDIAVSPSDSLIEHALAAVARLGNDIKAPFNSEDLARGQVLMLVDGLDEVADKERAAAVLQRLKEFHDDHPSCKIVLTSRKTEVVNVGAITKMFTEFQLSPLSGTQVERLVRAYAKGHSLAPEDSSQILQRLQELHGVELSPLIVTIFVATSDAKRSDVPANITQLFIKYTDLMLGTWDEDKGLGQQIQAPLKAFVLSKVAFRMHEQRKTVLAIEEFRHLIYEELKSRAYEDESDVLYQEITERSGLFRIERDTIEFKHLILQEFFAGKAITSTAFVEKVLSDYWWRNAIVFYFGLNPGDVSTLRGVADSLDAAETSGLMNAASAVGLSLQACYLSQIEDKITVFRNVIRCILKVRGQDTGGRFLCEFPNMLVLTKWIFLRSSVALSAIRLFAGSLYEEFVEEFKYDARRRDEITFWLVVALLQAGHIELAHALLKKHRFETNGYPFGIFLEMTVMSSEQIMSAEKKKAIRDILTEFARDIGPRILVFQKEMEEEIARLPRLPTSPSEREIGMPEPVCPLPREASTGPAK